MIFFPLKSWIFTCSDRYDYDCPSKAAFWFSYNKGSYECFGMI